MLENFYPIGLVFLYRDLAYTGQPTCYGNLKKKKKNESEIGQPQEKKKKCILQSVISQRNAPFVPICIVFSAGKDTVQTDSRW